MGLLSNKIDRVQLKPGDHIYSWRQASIIAHHGIYVGDGMVIHFTRGEDQETGTGTFLDRVYLSLIPHRATTTCTTPCPKCGYHTKIEGVNYTCLDCFLHNCDLYLFEYGVSSAYFLTKRGGTCTTAFSDPTKLVLRRALFLLDNGFGGYHTFKNNCEDFAMYCKTGLLVVTDMSVGQSGQATCVLSVAGAVFSSPLVYMTTSFYGLAMVGCGMYCVSRYVSDIGVRYDVAKVPLEKIPEMVKEDWPAMGYMDLCCFPTSIYLRSLSGSFPTNIQTFIRHVIGTNPFL